MKRLLALLLLLISFQSAAQVVYGKVVTSEREAVAASRKQQPLIDPGSGNFLLPGAVVRLRGTNITTVSDAYGRFTFTLPDSLSSPAITVSYAGFADLVADVKKQEVNVIFFTSYQPIAVSRNMQLKRYLRTGQKQVRRDLRKIH